MRWTDIFIRRPVLATCINLILLIAGLRSLGALNVRQYPRSDLAIVTITTVYVGASADLVRGYITTPLERVVASADGIEYLESSSQLGKSVITAHLRLNFDINAALTQIQSKINQVKSELPPESEEPVVNAETSDNRFASMYLSFFSAELDQNEITDYLTRVVQPRLSAIAGVQRADILGARTFAMRVWLKPERLAGFNLTAREVSSVLTQNNYLSTLGLTKNSLVVNPLIANTDLKTVEEFKRLVIAKRGEQLVRLADIADVVLGAESYEEDVRFGGQRATFMGVWVLPNANSLDVIRAVRAAAPDIERGLPSGMKMGIPYDSTEYINDSLHEVFSTLVETILIVVVVIYLFIGSLRSVLIPIVAIPLSLIGALLLMLMAGFTINLLTLLAIVLAVGLVVDDAIVMLENIERHVREGSTPFQAALKGARELVTPIISMTITLTAVYTPIAFQGGLTGSLFREFALTLAGAVFISGCVALTLSPMMCSLILKANHQPSRLESYTNDLFQRLRSRYERMLAGTLAASPTVLLVAGIVMLLIVPFYMFSGKELAPREDQGVVFGIVQAAPNSAIEQTLTYTEQVNAAFQSVPEYQNSFQLTSATGGFSGIVTKPWSQRSRTTQQIEGEMWGKVAPIPGIRVIVTTPPPLPGGSDFPVEMIINTTGEPRQLIEITQQLIMKAFQSGYFMFADTDLKFDQPQSTLVIDHDRVAALGLTLADVGADLSTLLGGNYVNRFSIQGRSYKVIPQVKRRDRLNPEQLGDMTVRAPSGGIVPVGAFATVQDTVEPRQFNRFQQLNSAKIQGATVPGVNIDAALSYLEREAAQLLPKGFSIDYAGESRQLRREGNALVMTMLLAFVVIFLVLAAQFESFRDPLIILFGSVPLALSGALLFTFLGMTTINIYTQVGLITLVGLVAKNGILIVEFANELQLAGRSKLEAISEASSLRLRPVLMTSVATVAGHFPLVLVSGAGAACRNSIGIVLVSGMAIGTIFTLFVVPSIYLVIAKVHTAAIEQQAESTSIVIEFP